MDATRIGYWNWSKHAVSSNVENKIELDDEKAIIQRRSWSLGGCFFVRGNVWGK